MEVGGLEITLILGDLLEATSSTLPQRTKGALDTLGAPCHLQWPVLSCDVMQGGQQGHSPDTAWRLPDPNGSEVPMAMLLLR